MTRAWLLLILSAGSAGGQGFAGSVGFSGSISSPGNTSHIQHTRFAQGVVYYGAHGFAPKDVLTWTNNTFDWVMAGEPPSLNSHNPLTLWQAGYSDWSYLYLNEGWDALRALLPYGHETAEDLYIHTLRDAYGQGEGPFVGTPIFDVAERLFEGTAVNGIWDFDAALGWREYTAPINQHHTAEVIHQTYFGYAQPYDQINLTITTPRSGGTVAYEYWNGTAWVALPTRTDSTAGLTTTGKILFNPPGDWARRDNGGVPGNFEIGGTYFASYPAVWYFFTHQKYWTRIRVTAPTTAPAFSSAGAKEWGADVSEGNDICGYATSPSPDTRINIGKETEYNPTPPANANCNFRYQSRIPRVKTAAYMNFGIVNPISGVDPIAVFHNARTIDNVRGMPPTLNAVMYDDYAGYIDYYKFPYSDVPPNYWSTAAAESMERTSALVREWAGAVIPGVMGFQIGANGGPANRYNWGGLDWLLCEGFWCMLQPVFSRQVMWAYGMSAHVYDQLTYDLAGDPVGNPRNGKLVMTCNDISPLWDPFEVYPNLYYWHFADLADRTPMECLAMHLIGWNPNVVFAYYTQDANYLFYGQTDDVFVYGASDTLTTELPELTSGDYSLFSLANNACGYGENKWMRIGTTSTATGPNLNIQASWSDNAHIWYTKTPIGFSMPAGTAVYCVVQQRLTERPSTTINDVFRWGNWFPARGVDIGEPDPNGMNGGKRMTLEPAIPSNQPWKTGLEVSGLPNPAVDCAPYPGWTCGEIWRRDYTKAIVLLRPWGNPASGFTNPEIEIDVPSKPIDLGGTYYRLHADGYTSGPITSIQLRANEGAVLMKAPIYAPTATGTVQPVNQESK